jgi:hypothetical protein
MEEQSVAELISTVTELNDIHLYFMDEDVDAAMATIIKLISKPNLPPQVAAPLIVQTQALAAKFHMMAKAYVILPNDNVSKEDRAKRKNTLFSLSESLEKLSNALKYLVK